MGFEVNDALARSFKEIVGSEVSFARFGDGACTFAGSTLPPPDRTAFASCLNEALCRSRETHTLVVAGDEIMVYPTPLAGEIGLYTVMHESLASALRPFREFRFTLLTLGTAGLALAILGSMLVARSVSRPVRLLAEAVGTVRDGNYPAQVSVRQRDEIGRLADGFNAMVRGLVERDRVRDLLGKVVSPEIAAELMKNREQVLGGEERVVTVLFADIRGYTRLSEGLRPAETLDVLNTYLTRMTRAIEDNGGVVDKFVGDAIMALFGAPLASTTHADSALRAAAAMMRALAVVNSQFAAQNRPPLAIGIGINTGTATLGNVGAPQRMNYTAIGDTVNIASRLEQLTKDPQYDACIVISESTLEHATAQYATRLLGPVQLRGRSREVQAYALEVAAPVPDGGGIGPVPAMAA